MNVLLICIYFWKDLFLLFFTCGTLGIPLIFSFFSVRTCLLPLAVPRNWLVYSQREAEKPPIQMINVRCVSPKYVCCLCGLPESPTAGLLSERGVANCSGKESWWTYADYSQHWPQVIIKCLPGVIFIYERTEQQTVGQTARGVGRVGASRGVAAFNTIIEFSWRRFEKT